MSLVDVWHELGDAIRRSAHDVATVTVTGSFESGSVRAPIVQASIALDDDVRVTAAAGMSCPPAFAALFSTTLVQAGALHRRKLLALTRVGRLFLP